MMDFESKWKAERERAAFLALDDGFVFHGVAFGARKNAFGEVVFNTGMSGYQEIVTDPSYAGQFVVLTTAEVGNYGVADADSESGSAALSGLVVSDLAAPSNWRSEGALDDFLALRGVPGLRCVDTRALAIHVRDHGNRKALLCVDGSVGESEAVKQAKAWQGLDGQDYASRVSTPEAYDFGSGNADQPLVAVYDFGVKQNILRSLATFARIKVFPAKTPAAALLAVKPDGIFLSNGPADPSALPYAIENIRKILAEKIPVMGICLGHQLLALACGAKTSRLAFGHHGCNHPVREIASGKVRITSQNHNYAVMPESLPECLALTHVNLNDGSVEGVCHKTLPAFSVQYHPEACPGPHDAASDFYKFRELISGGVC